MIRQQRPVAVLVIAILTFIAAGYFLISSFCTGTSLLLMPALFRVIPTVPGQPSLGQMMTDMYDGIPGFIPYSIITLSLTFLAGIVLIVASTGLLRLRPRARWTCVGLCVYAIIFQAIEATYQIAVVQPAMKRWMEDYMARMSGPGVTMTPGFMGNQWLSMLGPILLATLTIIYAIVQLVILFHPTVVPAFYKPLGGPPRMEEEDDILSAERGPTSPRDEHIRREREP
jgi:hypothetical protein